MCCALASFFRGCSLRYRIFNIIDRFASSSSIWTDVPHLNHSWHLLKRRNHHFICDYASQCIALPGVVIEYCTNLPVCLSLRKAVSPKSCSQNFPPLSSSRSHSNLPQSTASGADENAMTDAAASKAKTIVRMLNSIMRFKDSA